MTQVEAIIIVSEHMRLVRAEYNLSQEVMAEVIGLSKKTLIQVEKGRTMLGWSAVCATCLLFYDSEVLQSRFGDRPDEVIRALKPAVIQSEFPKENISVFWDFKDTINGYKIYQNYISEHFKVINPLGVRCYSTFDYAKALNYIHKHSEEV